MHNLVKHFFTLHLSASFKPLILVSVSSLLLVACSPSVPEDLNSGSTSIIDNFDSAQSIEQYTSNNADALPDVSMDSGRYRAVVINNKDDITLHFNQFQGRLDAIRVDFPFRVIARNVGVGTIEDSQTPPLAANNPVIFAGIQVQHSNLEAIDSSHLVVGHRWKTHFTVEGKNTVDGRSSVSDEGANAAPQTRADLLIVGDKDRTLSAFWQLPVAPGEPDQWQPYGKNGKLPGKAPEYGPQVYVGLITYAQMEAGIPFVGTADQLWINY